MRRDYNVNTHPPKISFSRGWLISKLDRQRGIFNNSSAVRSTFPSLRSVSETILPVTPPVHPQRGGRWLLDCRRQPCQAHRSLATTQSYSPCSRLRQGQIPPPTKRLRELRRVGAPGLESGEQENVETPRSHIAEVSSMDKHLRTIERSRRQSGAGTQSIIPDWAATRFSCELSGTAVCKRITSNGHGGGGTAASMRF